MKQIREPVPASEVQEIGVCPRNSLVVIPEGWFWMGSNDHYPWESPRHHVWLDAFAIAKTPVTRADYTRFLADTGHSEPAGWSDPAFGGGSQPVVGVNWFAAVRYCEWLSTVEGEEFRLPTEAEWEKACRGGLLDCDYAWGNEAVESFDYFHGSWSGPKPVGSWRANGFGIFHMGDNVHEWCSDWYAGNYYSVSPERNPTGPEEGTRRVSRGGSWRHLVKASRTAQRSSLPPSYAYTDYGFRLVKTER